MLKAKSFLWFIIAGILGTGITLNLSGQSCDPAIKLFNGQNLEGWYTFLKDRGRDADPLQVFTVADGMIRISGEEWGCITTEKEFGNYRLVVEFKWGEETFEPRLNNARDCGILLHSRGEDGGSQGLWMHSIECQIIEGGTGDFIVVGDGTENFQITCKVGEKGTDRFNYFLPEGEERTVNSGRINWFGRDPNWKDMVGFRGSNDIEKPLGNWNILVCEAQENSLSIYLNGMLVNQATHVKPSLGRIQIQSEGAEIFFRRIDLIPYRN
jgi:hypothetical protein